MRASEVEWQRGAVFSSSVSMWEGEGDKAVKLEEECHPGRRKDLAGDAV
jgi:hypothetical protein